MSRSVIPTHWSPEQALAVYEYLQQLSEHIWAAYHSAILDLIGPLTEEVLQPAPRTARFQQIELFADEATDSDAADLPF